ncbi:helix-turn-helix transcriptional regulator [Paenibacillus rhizolycopersici]|uniref:helix-turn-helix transcriptional regulator n=1 Tax=Paenibacillus rhizolycopersici TaxID=2780073 RepID=UPI003D2DBA48
MAKLREPGRSRLPELLEQNHLTARELSIKLDVTESHISQIINGKKFFSYPLAAKASQLLRCTMEDLHYWD